MQEHLENIRVEFKQRCEVSASIEDLEKLKVYYLGRKGCIKAALKEIGQLSPEERPSLGKLANEIKNEIEFLLNERIQSLKTELSGVSAMGPDLTLPGRRFYSGKLHPITKIMDEICSIFRNMGFAVAEGPEIELDFYNFEALNIPPDHPARDMQDTFYVDSNILLRTHTSPIQIRTMEKCRPPLRIIAPGKVYRCDSDITHTPMFHQVEGLMVDRGVSFSNLKGILTYFIHQVFDSEISVRFRPSFFPFTEPSAEVDIQCVMCRGAGCRVCKGTGWLEVLGAGMVHPQVFRHVGYDSEEFLGFAFGLGVERIAMLKYGIDDIRLFYENNVRFLEQF